MDDDLRQAIAAEVAVQLHTVLADVVRIWDEGGYDAAMNHGHLSPGHAMAAGLGDVLRLAVEQRQPA